MIVCLRGGLVGEGSWGGAPDVLENKRAKNNPALRKWRWQGHLRIARRTKAREETKEREREREREAAAGPLW